MKRLTYLIVLLWPALSFSQTGNYFLSHYSPSNKHFSNFCFDMTQDERGVMYFASNAGILEFDGRNWDMLQGKSAVYSVQVNTEGEAFWAGARGFGRIGYNKLGFQEMIFLSDSSDVDVFQAFPSGKLAHFLSERTIFTYDPASTKITRIQSNETTGSLLRLFELFGVLYVNTSNGIFKVDRNTLVPSKFSLPADITFISRIDDTYVIGTADNKVYVTSETLELKNVKIEDQEYAEASVIINGTWINRQLLALGTLRGGVIFINPITGRTQEIVNYSTGLPDNEVFAMMHDRNQNIWVAHEYGFTRIAPYIPFRTFSHYDGLLGNILCAYTYNNSVYAGTSLGLFKLEKQDVFEEMVYYVNVEIPQSSTTSKKNTPSPDKEDESKPAESKKKGLFNFLKKNRKKDNAAKEEGSSTTEVATASASSTPKYRREKRTKRIQRASQYVYRKVTGVDAKITHLLELNGTLIAAGLGGIYEVTGLQAKSVADQPVRYLYASDTQNILFASTYDDAVKCFIPDDKNWRSTDILDHIADQINFIFHGKENEIWLCGLDRIYRLELQGNEVIKSESLDLKNDEMQITIGVSRSDTVLMVNSDGFFSYNRKIGSFQMIDSLSRPSQYFAYQNSILYRDNHGWKLAGKSDNGPNLKLLNLFQDMRMITPDHQSGNLWMISKTNELYKFFGDKISTQETTFPLFLKTVVNNDLRIGSRSKINISEDKSAVTFEIVQPDYVSPEAVEFRYRLSGMAGEWSEWGANNNSIHFPYLPPGEYTLDVQSRNVFGQTTELDPMSFEVLPPYWKRSWFYAMEFALIATLVLLSFRLNARFRFVSRILSVLTIILLIEFIQTMIDATISFTNDSPVIDFIIQVFVALLILPVEGFLRNLMFRSLEGQGKFYQFIGPRDQHQLDRESLEGLEPVDEEKTM